MHPMARFGRTTWTTLLFVALLAPFVVVLVFSALLPQKKTPGTATAQLVGTPSGAGNIIAPGKTNAQARLLAAGDGKTLWLVRPAYADKDNTFPAYAILQRTSNTGVWSALRINDESLFSGFPRALAAIGTAGNTKTTALVMTDGQVESFTTDEMRSQDGLPPDHLLLATAGSEDGAFALTIGIPPTSTTRPGDRLDAAATTAPSTAPATASAPAIARQKVNAYWYHLGHWTMLPSIGEESKVSEHLTPRAEAKVALAYQRDRLIAMWVDTAEPRTLVSRSLDYAKGAAWSAPVLTPLGETVPADTNLLPVTLDQSVYLFWPVGTATSMSLHGGRLVTHAGDPADLTLPRENFLTPMPLTPSGDGVTPGADVALAPVENSFAVVISGKDGQLTCTVFNNRGQQISKPTTVEIQSPRHRMQVLQNVTMLAFLMVMVLALWQWRQRPLGVKLPEGMKISPLYLRALAFLIDFGIPIFITAAIFGLWDLSAWQGLLTVWINAFGQPEDLLNSPEILTLMGIYLAHVTLGELFFRRSIGKALTGLQVLMADGKSPTVAAVLLRNVIRLPEMIPGILMLNVLISTYHQRIGDFLAGTVVVSARVPETPEDPDAGEKTDAAKSREKEKV